MWQYGFFESKIDIYKLNKKVFIEKPHKKNLFFTLCRIYLHLIDGLKPCLIKFELYINYIVIWKSLPDSL